jgi:hypothetical protein
MRITAEVADKTESSRTFILTIKFRLQYPGRIYGTLLLNLGIVDIEGQLDKVVCTAAALIV